MTSMSRSPSNVALMESLYFLPAVIVSIPAGIIADFVNRDRLLTVILLATLLTQVVLAALVGRQAITPLLLLVLTFLLGTAAAFRNPPLDAELAGAVPLEELEPAFALDGLSFNLGRLVGPASLDSFLPTPVLCIRSC